MTDDQEENADLAEALLDVAAKYKERTPSMAPSIDSIISDAFRGGAQGFLNAVTEMPEYNWPMSVAARAYVQRVVDKHNVTMTNMLALFRSHANCTSVDKKHRRAFTEAVRSMKELIKPVPNPFGDKTGTISKVVKQATIGLDPHLMEEANKISLWWGQDFSAIESSCRHHALVGMKEGPRLVQD